MSLNVKPIGDKVIIQPDPAEENTKSGIYIPDTAKEKGQYGTVVAVGSGKFSEVTGNLVPLSVKVGDRVLFSKFGFHEASHEGQDYLIMKDSEILFIVQ